MLAKLLALLKDEAPPEPYDWLVRVMEQQSDRFVRHQFYFAFSGATRHFDKRDVVQLNDAEAEALIEEVPGFTVKNWTLDRLARVVLLLDLAEQHRQEFLPCLTAMLDTADIREAVAIYGGLPLYPDPDRLVPLAREGTRTNVVDIFDAIALDNPFPAEYFDGTGWNQMVLKAIFIDRPLYRIIGLRRRANDALSEALSNYAHERWSAGRSVTPELWRSCLGYIDDQIADDLERVAASDAPGQKAAAALVYHHEAETGHGEKLANLKETAELYKTEIESDQLTWTTLGQSLEKS